MRSTAAVMLLSIPAMALGQSSNPPAELPPPLEPATPSPFAPPPPDGKLAAPVGDTAELATIARVQIDARESGSNAFPPKAWSPPKDPSASFVLEHRPGAPLDVHWVQAQFERATSEGALAPSRAVAIVQLVNRAFVTAGFINSGLLVRQVGPDGTLGIELVYGRLVPAEAGATTMTIEWGGGKSGGLNESYVRARFPSSRELPLSAVALERDFRLLDESSAIRSLSASLGPGERPGEANLHLTVHPAERFDFYAGASNDRSPSVGGDRLFAGGYVRNLAFSGDIVTGEGGITRGVEDAQLAYTMPLFVPRLSFTLRGSMNDAAVVARPLELLDIKARDRMVEAGLNYTLLQAPLMPKPESGRWSASQVLSAGAYVMRRHQKSFLLGEPFSFAPGSVDGRAEFDAVRLTGDYLRRDTNRVMALSLGAMVGFDGTRSDIPGIPNPRRNFLALLGQLNFAQRLGSGFELRTRVLGQISRGTLYSAARLAVGGVSSVRGYRESLFLVDRGVIGTVEVARTFSLAGETSRGGLDWSAFTASIFGDAATFENAIDPQPEKRSIASVGASLAWTPSDAFRASITYGHALTEIASPANRTLQDRGVHFRIVMHPLALRL
jgi:hemolysin activation/secretion protein